ncbi:Uncharacterized protein PCOAH_00027010 [Plasmodium coatneyi]|uniref:Uncharacterized protein n=1 Tax=Plasmodium coatneyi TaxID=208452 RepID=A0A1B1DZ65_9APIC|nr:Uncharacterized protein PCOAH_00027010 [Plasmodium coatneyi]ANQ08091.1 Uncharacterized protein PCOAH_00027010 [Plasmodium coatneyi]
MKLKFLFALFKIIALENMFHITQDIVTVSTKCSKRGHTLSNQSDCLEQRSKYDNLHFWGSSNTLFGKKNDHSLLQLRIRSEEDEQEDGNGEEESGQGNDNEDDDSSTDSNSSGSNNDQNDDSQNKKGTNKKKKNSNHHYLRNLNVHNHNGNNNGSNQDSGSGEGHKHHRGKNHKHNKKNVQGGMSNGASSANVNNNVNANSNMNANYNMNANNNVNVNNNMNGGNNVNGNTMNGNNVNGNNMNGNNINGNNMNGNNINGNNMNGNNMNGNNMNVNNMGSNNMNGNNMNVNNMGGNNMNGVSSPNGNIPNGSNNSSTSAAAALGAASTSVAAGNGNSTNAPNTNTNAYQGTTPEMAMSSPSEDANAVQVFLKLMENNDKFNTSEIICSSINCTPLTNDANGKVPLADCTNVTYCGGCSILGTSRDQCSNMKSFNPDNILVSSGFVDSANLNSQNSLVGLPFVWDKALFDFSKCVPDVSRFVQASKGLPNADKSEAYKHLFRLANFYIYGTKLAEDNNANGLNVSVKINNVNSDSLKPNEQLPNGNNSLPTCPLNVANFKTFNIHQTQSFAFYQRLFIPESSNQLDSRNLSVDITNDQGYHVGNYFFYAKIECPRTDPAIENWLKLQETQQTNVLQNLQNSNQTGGNLPNGAQNGNGAQVSPPGNVQQPKSGNSQGDSKQKAASHKSAPSILLLLLPVIMYFVLVN